MYLKGNKKWVLFLLLVLVLFPLGLSFFSDEFNLFDITGFFSRGRDTYFDYIGNNYDSNSVMLWIPNNKISIKGFGITGEVSGTGTFMAHLITGTESYLISSFDVNNETIEFNHYCEGTCNLPNLVSEKYIIKITLDGVRVNLNNFVYSVKPLGDVFVEKGNVLNIFEPGESRDYNLNITSKGVKINNYDVFEENNKYHLILRSSNYEDYISKVEIKGLDGLDLSVSFNEIRDGNIRSEVFAVDSVEIEEAEITLEKRGNVEFITKCSNFNIERFRCVSGWEITDIPFEDHKDRITFKVNIFSAYAGGSRDDSGEFRIMNDFSNFCGGVGSLENPYRICNWYHLNNIHGTMADGSHFVLENSLDSQTEGYAGIGNNFTPLMFNYKNLNGQNHTISNLIIDRPNSSEFPYVGFLWTLRGNVSNIGLIDVNIVGNDAVGCIVGNFDWGIIENVYCTGNISGRYYVGGLVGRVHHSSNRAIILNSYAIANVSGRQHVGGLVGHDGGTALLERSYFRGSISGEDRVGGVVGHLRGLINQTYFAGKIINTCVPGALCSFSEPIIGGLVGEVYYDPGSSGPPPIPPTSGIIRNSYWDINVSNTTKMCGTYGGGNSGCSTNFGKTSQEMRNITTFVGWDIKLYEYDLNKGYPYFGWQINEPGTTWFIPKPIVSLIFVPPTPENNAGFVQGLNDSLVINVSVELENFTNFLFIWNNETYTPYDDSLVLMMNFDNYTRMNDTSLYGNHGSCSGSACPTWTRDGQLGGAYYFDGSDKIDIGANQFGGNNWSWSIWADFDDISSSSYKTLFSVEGNLRMYYYQNQFRIYGTDGSAGGERQMYDALLPGWNHYFFHYNSGTLSLYRNGEYFTQVTGLNIDSNIRNLILGYDGGYWHRGYIDEFRIYNRALSSEEISLLYNSNLAKFNSSQWYFTINQTDLRSGNNFYSACTEDIYNNKACTEVRNLIYQDCLDSSDCAIAQTCINNICTNNQVNIDRIFPISNVNVVKGNVFEIDVNVTCVLGDCGDLEVVFDPEDYVIVIFNESGTFEVPKYVEEVEVLVVGGGGGGATREGSELSHGAGGAGGLIYRSNYQVTPETNINVTVGLGGGTSSDGQPSSFGNLTALGGGGGTIYSGRSGGSGGGGGGYGGSHQGGSGLQSSSTSGGYGHSGGPGTHVSEGESHGGGGGGAGGPGLKRGQPGPGLSFDISGEDVTYATGGRAGGNQFGQPNTGDGGDSATSGSGRAGGSGIVIARYSEGKGIIPLNESTPFYTNASSNPISINLQEGESRTLRIWVNATGDPGNTYTFFEYVTVDNSSIILNKTSDYNVTIISKMPLIDFISPTPETNSDVVEDNLHIKVDVNEMIDLKDIEVIQNGNSNFLFDRSLILMMNFENNSYLNEYYTYSDSFVKDLSTYSNNGLTRNGLGSRLVQGKYGKAFNFNGRGDYISFSNSNFVDFKGKDFTINLWVKGDAVENTHFKTLLSKWDYNDNGFTNTNQWNLFEADNVGINITGYTGGVFDGRYIYFIPLYSENAYHGNVLRYDTLGSYSNSNSWKVYDVGEIGINTTGYSGGVFDGKYIYLIPFANGMEFHAKVLRYNVKENFTQDSSWEVYDATNVGESTTGYSGGVFDGRYIYFVPKISYHGLNGEVLRYDTHYEFTNFDSWDSFDASDVGFQTIGFESGIYDGKYIYFIPSMGTADILRYNTEGNFKDTSSWDFSYIGDVGNFTRGYSGGVFDGRYIYLIPKINGLESHGKVLRYDIDRNFDDLNSWDYYDLKTINSNYVGFVGGIYDGKYIYLIPQENNVGTHGNVIRYDTELEFDNSNSWNNFNTQSINSKAKGFQGAVYDGKYLYLASLYNGSKFHGNIVRYNTLGSSSFKLDYNGQDNSGGLSGNPFGINFYLSTVDNTSQNNFYSLANNKKLSGWNMITIQRNDSNLRLLVNNEEKDSVEIIGNITSSNSDFKIGHLAGNGGFNGILDELKIYNRSLSVEELKLLYESSIDNYRNVPGSERWSIDIRPKLNLGPNNYQICVMNIYGSGNCTETRTFNILESDAYVDSYFIHPTPSNNSFFTRRNHLINVKTEGKGNLYSFVDINEDLLIWHQFNNLIDSSEHNNNLIPNSGSIYSISQGKFGNSISLSQGNTAYINNHESLNLINDFTASFWFKLNNAGVENSQIISRINNESGWSLNINDEVNGFDLIVFENESQKKLSTNEVLNLSEWSLISFTIKNHNESDSSLRLYLNGNLNNQMYVKTKEFNLTQSILVSDGNNSLSLDELILMDRVLNFRELKALYSASEYDLDYTFDLGENVITSYGVSDLGVTSRGERRIIQILEDLDYLLPQITIHSPESKVYNNSKIFLNISAVSSIGIKDVWYNWNGVNHIYSSPVFIDFSPGEINLNVWASDVLGNINHTSKIFYVNLTLDVYFIPPTPENGSSPSHQTHTINVKTIGNLPRYSFVEINNDLKGFYRFNNFLDKSDYQNNLEVIGLSYNFVESKFGNALEINSGTDVNIPYNDSLKLENDFSLSIWFKLNELNNNKKIIGRINNSDGWELFLNENSTSLGLKIGSNNSFEYLSIDDVDLNDWNNIIFTMELYNSTHNFVKLYSQGELKSSLSVKGINFTLNESISFGDLNGFVIDELLFLDRSLNTMEINALFNAGDYSYEYEFNEGLNDITPYVVSENNLYLKGNTRQFTVFDRGSEDNPVIITTCLELQEINYHLYFHYVLGNHIDCSETLSWNDNKGFVPIGSISDPFTGSLKGKGYRIDNLYINSYDYDNSGLFGSINGAELSYIRLIDLNVSGNNVGGLVSSAYNSNISKILVKGVVNSLGNYSGGLVGFNSNTTISECFSDGKLFKNGLNFGGLVGINNGTIKDSYSHFNLQGNFGRVGGLVGSNLNESIVMNTYSKGLINSTSSNKGGLIGHSHNSGDITNSYWDITTSNLTTSSGGVGVETSDLFNISTFSNDWNIINVSFYETNISYIWNIVDGENYLFLSWIGPMIDEDLGTIDIGTHGIGKDVFILVNVTTDKIISDAWGYLLDPLNRTYGLNLVKEGENYVTSHRSFVNGVHHVNVFLNISDNVNQIYTNYTIWTPMSVNIIPEKSEYNYTDVVKIIGLP